ncbi:hypothetical protein IKQ19_01365 [Candidatus Saccharibacteria bacterium]|nr:hypothetical protein [Candidatus Saccharibacteria bacterium]
MKFDKCDIIRRGFFNDNHFAKLCLAWFAYSMLSLIMNGGRMGDAAWGLGGIIIDLMKTKIQKLIKKSLAK